MFKSKRELPAYKMPAVEECALWGARELRYEELLAVNGGKRKEADREKVFSEGSASSGGNSLADMPEKQQSLVNAEYIKQEMRKEEAGSGNAALSESASADSNASSDSGTSVSDSSSEAGCYSIGSVYYAADNLNIRSEPNLRAQKARLILKGQVLTLMQTVHINGITVPRMKVRFRYGLPAFFLE